MNRPPVGRLLARRWTVLVAVVVVAVAGFAVYRLHGIFGSNNDVSAGGALPNDNTASTPKHVVIEVFGVDRCANQMPCPGKRRLGAAIGVIALPPAVARD